MLYYILSLVLLFSGVKCDDNDTIAINGTEFRSMMQSDLDGRLNYWYINMT